MPVIQQSRPHEGVFLLLGDVIRVEPFSVSGWAEAIVGVRKASSLEDSQGGVDLFDILFEEGCASFYDSRLIAAAEKFRMVTAAHTDATERRVLARLGVARANALLRRYPVATSSIARAADDARFLKDPLLIQLTDLFGAMNASDWGRPVNHDVLRRATPADGIDPALHDLIETYRFYTLSRALLRGGAREEALEIMAALCSKPFFSTVASIPRGMSLRWHGILQTYKGNSAGARQLLENSINICRAVDYEYGEVQAALSLARVHAPLDRKRTQGYLTRASRILEKTDRAGSESSEGRQMLGERAQINSRLADVEFAQGRFSEALRLYKADLQDTREAAAEAESRTPRSIAYIRRNIGRTLGALLQWDSAIDHLRQSVELFQGVSDAMNVVFSQALLCEAYVETGRMDEGAKLIESMSQVLIGKKERQKEMAIVNLLSASLLWRSQRDSDRAHGKLQEAKESFRDQEPSYYDVRALMLEAEILANGEDEFTAVQRLREAKRKAENLELEDLKVRIDGMLERFDKGFNLETTDEFGKKNLTIFFADIRGFTDACQRIDTMMMAEFIKEFADIVSRQVSLGEGRPTRFLGDCVMALFGTRRRHSVEEVLAVRAAGQIWDRFVALRKQWGERAPDLEHIGLGFGIATGEVMVGRFGSGDLSEYSAIGAAVNLASRLQGHAEDGEILMCAETARAVFQSYPGLAKETRSLSLKGIGSDIPAAKVEASEVFTSVRRIRLDRSLMPSVASL